jgi:NADPH-dependent 2,4-dienoyl-CoA reductase/sulfur reductase-like enzyme
MDRPLVVVGASLAGLRAVESARKSGFDGPILLVGAEQHLPYDRPALSKACLDPASPARPAPYRTREELTALGVELRLGAPAHGLDPDAREVLVGGEPIRYGALVVATGAAARDLPGQPLEAVHTLRTTDDARAIRAGLDAGARTVVVGAGFIGSEVASAARARGVPVTILEAAPLPLVRAVGPQAAPLCTALHAAAGVALRCGTTVERFEVQGRVDAVRLGDGTRLAADLVVVGIGAAPATGWLTGSGLALEDGVLVDATLRASAPGVWAAGDVARVTHPVLGAVRLEHWTSAAEQGGVAGANAAASVSGRQPQRWDGVPYFWSELYGHKLQMVGLAAAADDVEILGSADGPWLVLYRAGDRFAAALGLDLPGRIMKFRPLLARGAAFAEALELAASRPLPTRAPALSA